MDDEPADFKTKQPVYRADVLSDEVEDKVGIADKADRLFMIGFIALILLVAYYGFCAFVFEYAIYRRYPDWGQEKKFDVIENPWKEISENTVPFVQKWYRDLDPSNGGGDNLMPSILNRQNSDPTDSRCIDLWFSEISQAVQETSPSYIEYVLQLLNLRDSAVIQKHLSPFLKEPQSLDYMYSNSSACIGQIHGMAELACILREKQAWNLTKPDELLLTRFSVHLAVVLEVLTEALLVDMAAMAEVTEVASNSQLFAKEQFLAENLSDEWLTSAIRNYHASVKSLQAYTTAVAASQDTIKVREMLQMSLLQAVKGDASLGHVANARLGLALAARLLYESFVKDSALIYHLGQEWIHSYTTWNVAFAAGALPYHDLATLLIPSISCRATTAEASDHWIAARLIAQAMWSLLVPNGNPTDIAVPQELPLLIKEAFTFMASSEGLKDRWEAAEALGQSNLQSSEIKSPSHNTVEEMLYMLCGGSCYDHSWKVTDTHVNSKLSDKYFAFYIGMLLFLTTLLAGWGLEIFVWVRYLQTWDPQREYWWRFAQFFFPLLVATTVGMATYRSFLALPILVVSLWKFGYPETVMYLYLGMYGKKSSKLQRASDFLNGAGTVAHHSAAVLLECMMLTGLYTATRSVYDSALFLVVQHWFALLSDVNTPLYVAVELCLEIWFDWIAMSNLFYLRQEHWSLSLGVCVFLAAHWTYFTAGGLSLLARAYAKDVTEENVHVRGTTSYRRRSTVLAVGKHMKLKTSATLDGQHQAGEASQSLPKHGVSTEFSMLARLRDEINSAELPERVAL